MMNTLRAIGTGIVKFFIGWAIGAVIFSIGALVTGAPVGPAIFMGFLAGLFGLVMAPDHVSGGAKM